MLKITSRTTKQDLADYAEEELGVKLDIDKSKDDLITEVRELEKENGIETDEQAPAENKEVTEELAPSKQNGKVVITIHQPPAPDEESEPDTHCVVGLNGRNFQLAYGEEITVPYGVYDILKNAKQTKYFTKKDSNGQVQTHSKVVQRYPFSFIRFA